MVGVNLERTLSLEINRQSSLEMFLFLIRRRGLALFVICNNWDILTVLLTGR